MKKIIIILAGILLMSSCKSYKKTAENHTRKMRLSKLLRETDKHRFSAKTLECRIGVSYSDPNQSFSGSGKIRILKDSIIWGSMNFLGIPMAKFYITPGKIQYYNKIDQTYYDGSFDLLEQEFGLGFNFNNLQNLLTGDLIVDVDPKKTKLDINPKNYSLKPDNPVIKKLVLTSFYKMLTGEFYHPSQGQIVLKYDSYQNIGQENIPENLEIKAGKKHMKINYKSFNINKKLRFPFKIPADYQKIKL